MPTLNWIGKEKVVNHHQAVPFKILEKQYTYLDGKESSTGTSENKIIHGDNLEALKSLLPQYEGKVDCIYIDPPYNTGNEGWVYNDNVTHPRLKKWLGEVVGKEGEDLSRHDKWLCMMYPRLKLLHKLLSKNGIVLISIANHELHNLRAIMDEIFGNSNFVQNFIWKNDGNSENQEHITQIHEYILCYAKDFSNVQLYSTVDPNVPEDSKIRRDFVENSVIKNGFKNPPVEITLPIGFPCDFELGTIPKTEDLNSIASSLNTNNYYTRQLTKLFKIKYPIKYADVEIKNFRITESVTVKSGFSNSDKLKKFIANKCLPYKEDDCIIQFFMKSTGAIYYRKEGRTSNFVPSILSNLGTTEKNKYLIESMGLDFNFPKPYELISFLLSFGASKGALILDSFAGSGTTAHAVLNLNKEDGGNRKFILIEMEDYAQDITAERVKRVVNGYGEGAKKAAGTGGDFSYYELGKSLFNDDQLLNEEVEVHNILEYVWYSETKTPYVKTNEDFLLGLKGDTAYYFYYTRDTVTTLDMDFLRTIKTKANSYIVYADNCLLSKEIMDKYHIIFKKIPRDISRF
jgi:adenine-specific DNA-methyltransferase